MGLGNSVAPFGSAYEPIGCTSPQRAQFFEQSIWSIGRLVERSKSALRNAHFKNAGRPAVFQISTSIPMRFYGLIDFQGTEGMCAHGDGRSIRSRWEWGIGVKQIRNERSVLR